MDTINLGVAIIAAVEAIKDTLSPKYKLTGNQTRFVALALGALIGGFGLFGFNIETGMIAGVLALGGHTLASSVGSAPQQTQLP